MSSVLVPKCTMDHIKFHLGRYRTERDIVTAVHEAGHAVVALCSGVDVQLVTIQPGLMPGTETRATGQCRHALSAEPPVGTDAGRRLWATRLLSIALAGDRAEFALDNVIRLRGHLASRSDDEDLRRALEIGAFADPAQTLAAVR